MLEFKWPIAFGIVAALGALSGAWVIRQQGRSRFVTSLICGVVGAALGSLGVNFLELPIEVPAGEAFIFIVTFFAAYLGPRAFSPLVSRVEASST